MSEQLITSVVTVLLALVGVGMIAVLVSNNSNTTGVISAGGDAFANDLTSAFGPIMGTSRNGNAFGGLGSITGGGASDA
jgi:hypothetical protein